MNAKQYLSQAYLLDHRIESLLEELTDLRSRADSIGGFKTGDRVQTPQKKDAPYVDTVLKIIDLERYIDGLTDELIDLKKDIDLSIESVNDLDEKLLLRYRYVNGHTWERIAVDMNISIRTVHRLHRRALQNFIVPK